MGTLRTKGNFVAEKEAVCRAQKLKLHVCIDTGNNTLITD